MQHTSQRAERTLAIAEQITHIGSWEWRPAQDVVYWSDELYRIYGYEPQSRTITADFFLSRVHPDDRDHVARHVTRALEQGGPFQWLERIVRPDGTVRLLETVGEVHSENGTKSLFGTCRDITEQRQNLEQIQRYADICRNVQIGLMVWAAEGKSRPSEFTLVMFNRVAEECAGLPLGPVAGQSLGAMFPDAVGGPLEALLGRVANETRIHELENSEWSTRERHRRYNFKAFPLPRASVGLAILEITEQAREQRLREAEHRVLERVASGAPLSESLTALIEAVESFAPPVLGSVLLLDPDGRRVRHGAAPRLPADFVRSIDGSLIGPTAGSCGTAAYLKEPVFVEDIETDRLWDDYRELARAHGLRACWSTPIFATDRRVLGTFAFYYAAPRQPSADDLALVARVSRLAGIAIEHTQMEEQLRDLSAHVESALEAERTRIAREIHDDLGQSLTALKMDIAWILRRLRETPPASGAPLQDKLEQMSAFTDEVIQRVRQISAELRPGVLDDLGLVAAIEWQAHAFEERTGTPCLVRADDGGGSVGREVATAAYRIVQEALTNVVRHAQAQMVRIDIAMGASELEVRVQDDGIGITKEAAGNPKSLGLLGIRERAHRLGGKVSVEPAEPRGTVVRFTLPLGLEDSP